MGYYRPVVRSLFTFTNPRTGKKLTLKAQKALIDTGASTVVLSKKAALELEKKTGPLEVERATVAIPEGTATAPLLKGVKVCLDGCCLTADVLVMDHASEDVIVGSRFLSGVKAKLDFGGKSLKCGGRTKKVRLVE